MKVLRVHDYEGAKIFITQHNNVFQYWFYFKGEMYMQWGAHPPRWYRWFLRPFGWELYTSPERDAIVRAYEEHAVRSIDHLIDPDAKHCAHNVVIKGNRAAVCPACNNKI